MIITNFYEAYVFLNALLNQHDLLGSNISKLQQFFVLLLWNFAHLAASGDNRAFHFKL